MGSTSSSTSQPLSRDEIAKFSKTLTLNQMVGIFGHECDRGQDDDQHQYQQNSSSPSPFNFWLCRVEEKSRFLKNHEQFEDSLLNCYGTNSKSGIFYFWLIRGLGSDNDFSSSLYEIKAPSKKEVSAFSQRAVLNFLVSEKSEQERRAPVMDENVFMPKELVESGIALIDEEKVGNYYAKQVMKEFMMRE